MTPLIPPDQFNELLRVIRETVRGEMRAERSAWSAAGVSSVERVPWEPDTDGGVAIRFKDGRCWLLPFDTTAAALSN